jgi:diaminopropionate ammonia-lyase
MTEQTCCNYLLNAPKRPAVKLSRKFSNIYKSDEIRRFHRRLRCYAPTPLVSLPMLAKSLGIKELLVKDESKRFRINTFKSLGASYAIAKIISKRRKEKLIFCTATDGNHGRSVAWAARNSRQKSVIYVPKYTTEQRIKNIKKYTKEVIVVDGDYDKAVITAREDAKKKGYILVQDNSWEGYTEIPMHITAGYKTMMTEMENSIHPPEEPLVDFVFLQVGNGTWASSMVTYYRLRYPRKMPKLVSVEPAECDCLLESFRNGKITRTTKNQQTVLAGLRCGIPSLIAFEILKEGIDVFMSIPDSYAIKAMQDFYYPFKKDKQIYAGESGAAGLGGLVAMACDPALQGLKKEIGLNEESRVLVFVTEGVTDSEVFEELLSKESETVKS